MSIHGQPIYFQRFSFEPPHFTAETIGTPFPPDSETFVTTGVHACAFVPSLIP